MKRWNTQYGYKDVLTIGIPMVVSMGATTVMQVTDRIFLGWYNTDALAASIPATLTSLTLLYLFMGILAYVNVFVAQNIGADQPEQVGQVVWQGIFLALAGTVLLAATSLAADTLFTVVGHPPAIAALEATYFKTIMLGAGFMLLGEVFSCFFSGRGITRVVMVANISGMLINVPLDYALINGTWGFPELGMQGAGLATIAGWFMVFLVTALSTFTRANCDRYQLFTNKAFNIKLLLRMIKYGTPNGINCFVELSAITFFTYMAGRIGAAELAAMNVAFSMNNLSFLPVFGMQVAVATMVGQAVGAKNTPLARYGAHSAAHINLVWMAGIGLIFILFPEQLTALFQQQGSSPQDRAILLNHTTIFLRFVAIYGLLDAISLTYFGALKGAGDVHFVMKLQTAAALLVMIIPLYLCVEVFKGDVISLWCINSVFVLVQAVASWKRFMGTQWYNKSVLDPGN